VNAMNPAQEPGKAKAAGPEFSNQKVPG